MMSNLDPDPHETISGGRAGVATEPVRELLEGRDVVLGGTRGMSVVRTLPNKERRMVGAWCFVDSFGPESVNGGPGMRVAPHPHTGLQTVTWLVQGEVLHRDSLANQQLIHPGQLNLMTAGRGISHAEESPTGHGPVLQGVQLWVALPDEHRGVAPFFDHHRDLPDLVDGGVRVRVLMGELGGALAGQGSPARAYSPLVGAEVAFDRDAETRLGLEPDFEYAAVTLSGAVEVDGVLLSPGSLLYLGCGRVDLALRAEQPGRLLLLGGEPFDEEIIMWWNFIGRSHDEIVRAREDWMTGRGFGEVRGYDGEPLPAPAMPTSTLKPRGRLR